MRADTVNFRAANLAAAKSLRLVVEQAFDSGNTVLRYFTSHADAELPAGVLSVDGVVESPAGTSQRIDPDKAVATIGSWSCEITDVDAEVTALLAGQFSLGRSTRRQRARFYVGHEFHLWADYSLVQTQQVEDIEFDTGAYKFRYADVQRSMRQEIFDLTSTRLAQPLTATATTVQVDSTTAFELLAHGSSYSDAPNATVGYIRIDDEIIRYTGKTATSFTGCTRGVLNTLAVEHNVDATADPEQRTEVQEYVYLELPAVKLALALLTGDIYTNDSPTSSLPSSWHLDIDAAYVTESDFLNVGKDLWDPDDDEQGFVVRFEGLEKTDGKQFIERELMLLLGCFMPVYADGSLGLKRMANVLAGAAYVAMLDNTNVVEVSGLRHDFKSLHNQIEIGWNWDPKAEKFTRRTAIIDASSITVHGPAEPYKVNFRGLHGSRHSSAILRQRFDAFRDRYTGPPLRCEVKVLPSLNVLEVGDIVRLRLDSLRDFVANDVANEYILDRSWEVQQSQIDWATGTVALSLFASSQAPGAQAPTADATALSDAWYNSAGTALSSALTITGSNPGHVSANGSLTGNADMNAAGAIYYYLGDLVIDAGVVVTISQNVQLRVRGTLTINGEIRGIGGGLAGASQISSLPSGSGASVDGYPFTSHNDGTAGFLGSPKSGGGYHAYVDTFVVESFDGHSVVGANDVVPAANLAWNGTTLSGIFADLRGSSGSTGNPTVRGAGQRTSVQINLAARGGAGGAGGAGLCTVSRGVAFGVSGRVNLSGADGSAGETFISVGTRDRAGSGAGGAPGGWLILLDGTLATVPGLTNTFVADYGDTPITGNPITSPAAKVHARTENGDNYPYYVGTGDGRTFPVPTLSGTRGGARVQFVPGNPDAVEDPAPTVLDPPTALTLDSIGESFVNTDGVTVPRILADWDASPDPRTLGYEVQFRLTPQDSPPTETVWQPMPTLFGATSTSQWVHPVRSGVQYDVRVRAVGPERLISSWVTVTEQLVSGDETIPGEVGDASPGMSFDSPYLAWPPNTEDDLAGYIVRWQYQSDSPRGWAFATAAHEEGFITVTQFNTLSLLPVTSKAIVLFVKAVDRSGNESVNAAEMSVSLPVDIFSSTSGSIAAGGFYTINRTHNLGTDDVDIIVTTTASVADHFRGFFYNGKGYGWQFYRGTYGGDLPSHGPAPTGEIRISLRNDHSTSQTFTHNVVVYKRSASSS